MTTAKRHHHHYRPAPIPPKPASPSTVGAIVATAVALVLILLAVKCTTPATADTAPVQPAPVSAPAPEPRHIVTMGEVQQDRADDAAKAYAAAELNAEVRSPMPASEITGDISRDVSDWAHDADVENDNDN